MSKLTDSSEKSEKVEMKRAVALHYDNSLELPTVLASGLGALAEKIVAIAKAAGVPIEQDRELSDLLSKAIATSSIKPEGLQLVSEVVSFLYLTDKEWQSEQGKPFATRIQSR